ncbi:MAG: hypothetical protein ACI97A_001527 [Planctomycetota bacterium]|jgi:hypothetical protein
MTVIRTSYFCHEVIFTTLYFRMATTFGLQSVQKETMHVGP